MPFSTLPWNWLGTVPPTIRCSKTMPEPGGPGSASTTTTAYCPCPPDCFTCRPVTRAGAGQGLDHRHPDRHGVAPRRRAGCAAAPAAPRRARPPRTTAAAGRCRGGVPAGRSGPRRPAGPAPSASRSSSARRGRLHRDRAAAAWAGPRAATSRGSSGEDSVSPVSALVSRATAQMSPAGQAATGRSVAPSGEEIAPTRSSTSWSGCPRSAMPCPETCTGMSGRRVPEKTRTSETRPR